MSFEGYNLNNPQEEKLKETPKRLMFALESLIKLQIGEIKTKGSEHVKEIPKDRKVIIVCTHITDLDVPITATVVGKYFDLAMTNMSVHHSLKEEPSTYLGIVAAGKDNFFPIDFEKNKEIDKETGKKYKGAKNFNPNNFTSMAEAMNTGKSILIAGHKPSHTGEITNPGYGAAYLAEITNAIILPVSVHIESENSDVGMYGKGLKTFMKKPGAKVTIGAPFEIEPIENIDQFSKLLEKRSEKDEHLTKEEIELFLSLSKSLRERSQEVLGKISTL